MSLKPGSQVAESYSELSKGSGNSLDSRRSQSRPGMLQLAYIQDQLGTKDRKEGNGVTEGDRSWMSVSNGEDLALCSPPRTENEVQSGFGGPCQCYFLLKLVFLPPINPLEEL